MSEWCGGVVVVVCVVVEEDGVGKREKRESECIPI